MTRSTHHPLTAAMRAMWLDEQIRPGTNVNHLGFVGEFRGPLEHHAVEAAVDALADRHEMLRATIDDRDGRPLVAVRADIRIPVEWHDGADWSEAELRSFADDLILGRPYDLRAGPLARCALVRRGADRHVLVVALHHMIGDLWSVALLSRDLLDHLVDGAFARPPRAGYADHEAREREYLADGADDDRAFWTRNLSGSDAVAELPFPNAPADPIERRAGIAPLSIDAELHDRLAGLADRAGVDLAAVMLAAWAVVTSRYVDRTDLSFGTVRANRTVATAKTIGCFVNPLVLRVGVDDDESFESLVRRTATVLGDALRHGRFPAGQLLTAVSGADRNTPNLGFLWQKSTRAFEGDMISSIATGHQAPTVVRGELEIDVSAEAHRGAPFDLGLVAAGHPDGVLAGIEYAEAVVTDAQATELAAQLTHVLRTAATDPSGAVRSLGLVPADERTRYVITGPDQPADDRTVDQLVRERLSAQPDRLAIVDSSGDVTAADLLRRIDAMHDLLAGAGAGPGQLVGVMLARSADLVAAVIAVMETGAAYVPFDPEFPAQRLAYMATDAQLSHLVCDATTTSSVPAGVEVLRADLAMAGIADGSREADRPASRATPDDRAYVMYTSGSTGNPKGVEVLHSNVTNFLHSMAECPGLTPDDRLLAITTISFDISVLELFLPLVTGATIVLADRATVRDADALARLVTDGAITVAQATPTTWRMLVETGWKGSPDVRVLCGGEPLTRELADELLDRAGDVWNMYGPTETTVWSAVHRVARGDTNPPIGAPIHNTSLCILDRCGQLTPEGLPGELFIGGAGVARGYLDRPELTTERFVSDVAGAPEGRWYRTGDLVRRRPDGEIEHLGRTDQQIKVRGHRIELGEIESVLDRHPSVAASVVTAWEPSPGDVRLVAYAVPRASRLGISATPLREHLAAALPRDMVPAQVVELAALPLTPNAKVDRGALPSPVEIAVDAPREAPAPGVETTVAAIWAEVLGRPDIARHDDFFALGGHSMLATRIASRLRTATNREVTVRTIFDHPTVAGLARTLRRLPLTATPSLRAGELVDGPLSHAQERMWFLHEFDPGGCAYNIATAIRVTGPFDPAHLSRAVVDLAARHEGLRTTFELGDDGTPRQRVHAESRIDVEVVDHRPAGDGAFEAAVAAATAMARRPFRLAELPLMRVAVHRIGDDEHLVALALHHIVCDQWALGLIAAELGELYRARLERAHADLPPDPVQQLDYARWHRALVELDVTERQLPYWRERLAGLQQLELPTDRPHPDVRSSQGGAVRIELGDDRIAAIAEVARRERTSAFAVCMAAFQAVLARVTGTDDIAVATAVANRNWLEAETVVSSLVNTVIIRTDVGADTRLDQLLERVRTAAGEAFEHQDLPFAVLVSELVSSRAHNRQALTDVFFNLANAPIDVPTFPGTQVEVVPLELGASQFDLSLSIDLQITGVATLEYRSDLFDRDRVAALLDDVITMLDELVRRPEHTVSSVALVSADAPRSAPLTVQAAGERPAPTPHESPRPGTERRIAAVWTEILAVPDPSRHDDFFDQGGHSLLAVRMIARLEHETGRRLPISALFAAPTIADLARLVDEADESNRWTSLVPVQPQGERTPFFYVAPFLITSLSFAGLGRAIGDDQPLYVLQPQGIDTDDPVHDSVAAMAAHYVDELRTVQPHGPYVIGGHCAGATPALEMARLLRSEGEVVSLLVIVDGEPPHVSRPRPGIVTYVVDRVRHYRSDGRLLHAIAWSLRVAAERVIYRRVGSGRRRELAELRSRHAQAHAEYVPGDPVDVGAILIRSAEWMPSPEHDWLLRWSELITGELGLASVPGTHAGLVSVEQAGALAEVLRAAIDAAAVPDRG